MLSRLRLMLTGLFMSFALIACGDDAANTNEAADTAAPAEMDNAAETATDTKVEATMSEADLIEKYGEPDLTQERSIDDLTIVHHEWLTDEGIVSVQIHNGEVAYSQFTPKQ